MTGDSLVCRASPGTPGGVLPPVGSAPRRCATRSPAHLRLRGLCIPRTGDLCTTVATAGQQMVEVADAIVRRGGASQQAAQITVFGPADIT